MRTPSEYVAAAVRSLRSNAMRDCGMRLTRGGLSATVTRVGTVSRGEDTVTESGPAESVRVLCLVSDFPELDRGDVVELDASLRVVTSARTDPAKASMTVGLSDRLERVTASWRGRRAGREMFVPVGLFARCDGQVTEYADGYAPVTFQAWTLVVPCESWTGSTPPQIGDEVVFDGEKLRVSKSDRRDRHYVISARGR